MRILILVILFASACAPSRTASWVPLRTPESIQLLPGEDIPLPANWVLLEQLRFPVRGQILYSNLTPNDTMHTQIFARTDRNPPEFLLLSHVRKPFPGCAFRFLDGQKELLGTRSYRHAPYVLSSNSADPEYKRYLKTLRAHGFKLTPQFLVTVYDRLPTDTTLLRVMFLRHGTAMQPLPSYGNWYPQERSQFFWNTDR